MRERAELRRELDSLTAQARISRRVVTLLPPCVAGLLYLINPTYMRPLINTTGGQIVLAFAGLLVIAGSLIMRKITDIAV